jgi:hypothetical protein
LSWAPASDAETPVAGLSYNLSIGTTSAGLEVLPPMADLSNGFRLLPKMGNTQLKTSRTIKNLSPGKYYWRVQTIDNNFEGSDFTPLDSFYVGQIWTGNISADWNNGGNWLGGIVPDSLNPVEIPSVPAGGIFPVIDSDSKFTVKDLIINDGATIDITTADTLIVK